VAEPGAGSAGHAAPMSLEDLFIEVTQ
jgi:hypothetical protein